MEDMFDCFPKSKKVLNQCCKSFAEYLFKWGKVLSSAQIIQVKWCCRIGSLGIDYWKHL